MQTVIGAFDNAAQAEKAAQDLVSAGVARDDISLVANNEGGTYGPVTETTSEGTSVTGHAVGHDAKVGAEWGAGIGFLVGLTGFAIPGLGWIAGAGWLMGTILGAGTGAVIGGLTGALTHVGVPEADAVHYNAAVQHGSVLLAVRASESQAPQVADILDKDGAINIDERVEQYQQKGFLPSPSTPMTTPVSVAATVNTGGEQVLQVVEESLAVGKRQVQSGGVRVFSHVTEKPVEASVNLREEHVTVDRRPVDRPADASAFNTVQDGVVEVTETKEVPVVAKEARVVEEVVVGKVATQRTETVHDTVRRTDVEVEHIVGQASGWNTGVRDIAYMDARLPGNPDTDYPDPPSPPSEGSIPGVQTGGQAVDGSGAPDTRGITEKVTDTLTGARTDDKTGRPV